MKYIILILALCALPALGQTDATNTVIHIHVPAPAPPTGVATNWTATFDEVDQALAIRKEGWREIGDNQLIRGEDLQKGDVITLLSGQSYEVGRTHRDAGTVFAVFQDGRHPTFVGWGQIREATRGGY